MRKTIVVFAAAAVVALSTASPASAVCPAAPGTDPGRSEFAQHHIVEFAHAGLLGHVHKPGKVHQGASDCEALNP
jgi:hypothetical protein